MINSALSRSASGPKKIASCAFIQVRAAAHDDSEAALIEVGTVVGMAARDLRISLSRALKLGTIHDVAVESEDDPEPIFLSCEVSSRGKSTEDTGWLLRLNILNASDTDLHRWDSLIERSGR